MPDLIRPEIPELRSFSTEIARAVRFCLGRNYLEGLTFNQVPNLASEDFGNDHPQFLKFERIGHGMRMDQSLDLINLQNVLGSFRNCTHSLITVVASERSRTNLFMGAQRLPKDRLSGVPTAATFLEGLRSALKSNLPGTRFYGYPHQPLNGGVPGRLSPYACSAMTVKSEIKDPMADYRYVTAITGIPSLRGDRGDQAFQSMDRFIEAMLGRDYMLMIIAEPVSPTVTNDAILRCEELASDVHALVKTSISACESVAEQESSSQQSSKGTSTVDADNITEQEADRRAVMGPAVGAAIMIAATATKLIASNCVFGLGNVGSAAVQALLGKKTQNRTHGRTITVSENSTEMTGVSTSRSQARTATYEHLNKAAESTERLLDEFRGRFERARALGLWQTGVYIFADDLATIAQGQAQLMALYSGSQSQLEPVRSILIGRPDGDDDPIRREFQQVLGKFQNPSFDGFRVSATSNGRTASETIDHPLGPLFEGLATPLNTEELSVLLNLPRREIAGIRLQQVAEFGLNPPDIPERGNVVVGKLMANGVVSDKMPVNLDRNEFLRHAFLTGITGAGKTNTALRILRSLHRNGVPFMVIEPAKTEYRQLLLDSKIAPSLKVFTLGDQGVSPFTINPFEFIPGVNLLSHIDTLKSIFNAAFGMFPPLPYVLEECIVNLYEELGWDLASSENLHLLKKGIKVSVGVDQLMEERGLNRLGRHADPEHRAAWVSKREELMREICQYMPKLEDLYEKIDSVVDAKGYAPEIARNTKAALRARIGSLRIGSKGAMLDVRRGLDAEIIFDSPVILEMHSLADDDEKAFIMALLTSRLYQYRMQQYREGKASGLKHLCVLEEAHRLLRKAEATGEGGNPRGKAVEMFASLIAEIRKYGQGFLIADQSPGKLIPDVLKNTNIKLMHRLVAKDDREAVASTMGLSDEQQMVASRLGPGEVILHSNDLDKPLWVQVDREDLLDDLVSDRDIRRHMQQFHHDECGNSADWEARATVAARALSLEFQLMKMS